MQPLQIHRVVVLLKEFLKTMCERLKRGGGFEGGAQAAWADPRLSVDYVTVSGSDLQNIGACYIWQTFYRPVITRRDGMAHPARYA
jgi:hypothetical protein